MMAHDEVDKTAQVWRIRFQTEFLKRGGTQQARQKMINETPDWLRRIIGLPLRFGERPINCTCARWYLDGTHHKNCLHLADERRRIT